MTPYPPGSAAASRLAQLRRRLAKATTPRRQTKVKPALTRRLDRALWKNFRGTILMPDDYTGTSPCPTVTPNMIKEELIRQTALLMPKTPHEQK